MSDISFPINTSLNNYQSHHAGRMYKHYAHAREKHPYFCDDLLPELELDEIRRHTKNVLTSIRKSLEDIGRCIYFFTSQGCII